MAEIMVICAACHEPVLVTEPEEGSVWPVWHWHEPCRYCGNNEFHAVTPAFYYEKYVSHEQGKE